jgi:bifunctional non-homologous end joining protein LigD
MTKQPQWIPPMLAVLYKKESFDDPDWLFEKKLDGVRCLAFFDGNEVRLMTRNKRIVNREYPEIAQEIKQLSQKPFILDGEIVVGKGKIGSFSQMQNRIGVKHPSQALQKKYPLYYYAFDLLYSDDADLRQTPLIERKQLLKKLSFTKKVLYTPHQNEKGKAQIKKMRQQHYEGVIAKKRESTYESKRSRQWLKLKIQNRQELVIGGYTDPKGTRKGFGALLVGFYSGKELVYAGKVGTGFTDAELNDLHKTLKKFEKKNCPFQKNPPKSSKEIHWTAPKYVAEVAFTEWTSDNKLRHPSFVGLREDKSPEKVVKEE